MLHTRENSDVFNTLDEIYWVFSSKIVNILYVYWKPLNGYFGEHNEDPDEMQHNAAFYQGLHCLLILKQPSGTEKLHNLENFTFDPSKSTTVSTILIVSECTYCIRMYGKFYRNIKG